MCKIPGLSENQLTTWERRKLYCALTAVFGWLLVVTGRQTGCVLPRLQLVCASPLAPGPQYLQVCLPDSIHSTGIASVKTTQEPRSLGKVAGSKNREIAYSAFDSVTGTELTPKMGNSLVKCMTNNLSKWSNRLHSRKIKWKPNQSVFPFTM